jgi:hypothetical protein
MAPLGFCPGAVGFAATVGLTNLSYNTWKRDCSVIKFESNEVIFILIVFYYKYSFFVNNSPNIITFV